MSSLSELATPEARRQMARQVARMAEKYEEEAIGLNHGFKNDAELIACLKDGYKISFDYKRLMEEAGKYA